MIVVYSLLIMVAIVVGFAAVVYFGANISLAMSAGLTLKERLILLFWGLPLLIQAIIEIDPEN